MNIIFVISLSMLSINLAFAADHDGSCNTLFQASTFAALLSENYDGDYSVRQLEQKGGNGLGTFNAVDGDMIAVDGNFYQIAFDGKVKMAQPILKTPFAQVTCFTAGDKFSIGSPDSYDSLKKILAQRIKNKNIPYAFRIDGEFDLVKLSSSKEQHKPYKPLDTGYQNQFHYQIQSTEGTLIGFWFPDFMGSIGVPGFHFHMINKERSKGGHLIDVKINRGKVTASPMNNIHIKFPHNKTYGQAKIQPIK